MKAYRLESAVISSRRVGFGDYMTIRKGQLYLGHQSDITENSVEGLGKKIADTMAFN